MAKIPKVTVKLVLDPEVAFEGPVFDALVAAVAERLQPEPAPPPDDKARMQAIIDRTREQEAGSGA
jgi:hypothetical protein